MRTVPFDDPRKLNPVRTMAIAGAMVVHIGAMLFLLAPIKPAAQAQVDDIATQVIFIDPPLPPPPPPPPAVVSTPPPAITPPPLPRTPPPPEPVAQPPEIVCADCDVADDDIISEEPSEQVAAISGPPADAFSSARADARYGDMNRVQYPALAIRKREQGAVQVRVLIAADGSAQKVELLRSSGSRVLDAAALKSVRGWRFVAAERDGVTVSSWAIVPIEFNLDRA